MHEHTKRIQRIQSLCDELDAAMRQSKDLHATAAMIEAEATALAREIDQVNDKRRRAPGEGAAQKSRRR